MLDSDGSVHLETNGQTFIYLLQSLWTLASDSCHLLANVLHPDSSIPKKMSLAQTTTQHQQQDIYLSDLCHRGSVAQPAPMDETKQPNYFLPNVIDIDSRALEQFGIVHERSFGRLNL
jgi:hypothetical protein